MLAAALMVAVSARGSEPPFEMDTRAYLDLPELFQLSVVAGSMAMLRRWADESDDAISCECYDLWHSAEDVLAVVSLHARHNPAALRAPFADTLIAALDERCAKPPDEP